MRQDESRRTAASFFPTLLSDLLTFLLGSLLTLLLGSLLNFHLGPQFLDRGDHLILPREFLILGRVVGGQIRDIYAEHSPNGERLRALSDDGYIKDLAQAVAGNLGGKVGIAPRIFLKKLVADILDRIDQFPDFDPRQHYALTVSDSELTEVERNARAASSPDDIELEL